MFRVLLAVVSVVACAYGHALPTPVIQGPLRVRGNALLDVDGRNVELVGVNVPGAETKQHSDILFKVIRRRWNLNAVRIPVSVSTWVRDGEAYLSSVERSVRAANQADLAVVLVAREDASLPSARTVMFWRAWAERFRENNRVIFDIFDKPSSALVTGRTGARREPAEWDIWLNGGTASDGRSIAGMKQLVEAIRSAGANHVIAVQAFSDQFGFQGFDTRFWLPDPNVIYEIHPYFDRAQTAAERDAAFGLLAGRLHLYAGEWGLTLREDGASCRNVPRDTAAATALVFDMLRYFGEKRMSWTASSFEPGSLVVDYETYGNTRLDRVWTCGDQSEARIGMGELVLLAMTGDPTGFGELLPDFIANAATGLIGPIAPGEIIAIYGAEIGPFPGVAGQVDANGRLPLTAGKVQVFFDGVAAPVFFASAYQVNVQVPYSVAGKQSVTAQLFYDEVPSSKISLSVADASPGIFADFSKEAKALNQDGSINSAGSPAAPGSVVVLFGTGSGMMSPGRAEGHPAAAPLSRPVLPVSVRIGSEAADLLYAGEAPGLIGVVQLNVRVPSGPANTRAVTRPVEISIGPYRIASPVTIWMR